MWSRINGSIIHLRTMHCERIHVILPQHADFPGVAGLIPFTGQVSITFWTYQSYMMNHKSLLIDMFPSNDFFFQTYETWNTHPTIFAQFSKCFYFLYYICFQRLYIHYSFVTHAKRLDLTSLYYHIWP